MSRDGSITLSPKHGVNPTIPVCFWCGKQKNEIALLGRVWEKDPNTGKKVRGTDMEAPMCMCLDPEPCEDCARNFSQGVVLMECVDEPNGMFSVTDSEKRQHWLTGRYAVMRSEGHEGEKCLCDVQTMEQVLSQATRA